MEEPTMTVIDCAVYPEWRHSDELREHMEEPWRSKPFAQHGRVMYPNPIGDVVAQEGGSGPPGSDPVAVARRVFDEGGADVAILLPFTRGLHPDVDLDSEICAATNRWLSERWLDAGDAHGRFRGSIRVCPRAPERAVAEIERWAEHPAMVQVAVPLHAHHPYG
jgi:predicted TIM-barrel fold metal-dependent hydrolase